MDAKYLQITESIKRQIRNGDYLIEKVPSERKLADSFGVSYMTARRAVQQLIEDRFFLRCENGRLAIGPAAVENAGRLNVGRFRLWTNGGRRCTNWCGNGTAC